MSMPSGETLMVMAIVGCAVAYLGLRVRTLYRAARSRRGPCGCDLSND